MTSNGKLTLDFIKQQAEEEQLIPTNFKQVKLTKKFLLPHIRELQDDMLSLRLQFDREFEQARHPKKANIPRDTAMKSPKASKSFWCMSCRHQRPWGLARYETFV